MSLVLLDELIPECPVFRFEAKVAAHIKPHIARRASKFELSSTARLGTVGDFSSFPGPAAKSLLPFVAGEVASLPLCRERIALVKAGSGVLLVGGLEFQAFSVRLLNATCRLCFDSNNSSWLL